MHPVLTMSAAQLTQRLLALEHDYAQYRVEKALYVDKLERRLEEAERNLSRVPLRSGLFGASYLPHQITVPGLSEHRADARAPPPINTAPAMAPAPIHISSFSPFARDPAHTGTPNEGVHDPARGSRRPPKNMGSGENAAFLPYAIRRSLSRRRRRLMVTVAPGNYAVVAVQAFLADHRGAPAAALPSTSSASASATLTGVVSTSAP